jgi:hypothetical protein
MIEYGMGIWGRLGNVIKSYLHDEDAQLFGNSGGHSVSGDPDLDAAFDEINEYLNQDRGAGHRPAGSAREGGSGKPVPEELRSDFAELGVEAGASADECKAAYKRLLKIHHPDRHAGHGGNFRKATDKTARINAAYDRIEHWRKSET